MLKFFLLAPFFLAWGSFLNMLAYRLICQENFSALRSFCTSCKSQILWHDNIPLLSWFILRGSCRFCNKSISWLYPFIEFLSLVLLILLTIYIPGPYYIAYFVFFSALIISIRTDLQFMLISRFATLYAIPIGWLFAYYNLLPITFYDAVLGSCSAYFFLFAIAKLFFMIRKIEGMGQGDLELLAFIGSFLGVAGWWATVLIGSLAGSLFGIIYCALLGKYNQVKIPFGPFLALGAIVYTLWSNTFLSWIL